MSIFDRGPSYYVWSQSKPGHVWHRCRAVDGICGPTSYTAPRHAPHLRADFAEAWAYSWRKLPRIARVLPTDAKACAACARQDTDTEPAR